MKKALYFFLAFIFGLGIEISQMTNPKKVVGFLNVFGEFDPSLILVMAGAIIVYSSIYFLLKKRKKPIFENEFKISHYHLIDSKLVTGAALFGMGWGMSGFCPAPIIVSITKFELPILIALIGMSLGMFFYHVLFEKKAN
jgi:uncharacterized membrane protein YedE/YeeE